MSQQTRLTETEIGRLEAGHPGLPTDYVNYLRDVGWGATPSGHMIYSGPIPPEEFYPQLSNERGRVLLGDDFQGYCLGYDLDSEEFGEYSETGEWLAFEKGFELHSYLNGNEDS